MSRQSKVEHLDAAEERADKRQRELYEIAARTGKDADLRAADAASKFHGQVLDQYNAAVRADC